MSVSDRLAQRLGISERTLRRAIAAGTLRGRWTSPRRLELSASEQDYALRRWPLLGALRSALRTERNVRSALLYGSAARGEDTDSSDVDLLVELADSSLVRLIDLEAKLEGLLGRRVDVVPLEDSESNPLLLAEAVRDGRVIVDREGRWPALRAEAEKLQLDADESERRRAGRALRGLEELLSRR